MSPGNDVLRASYREPEEGRQLLEPGRVYELRLPNLITAIRFARGHPLRVQISASFAPHFLGHPCVTLDKPRPRIDRIRQCVQASEVTQ